MALNNAKEIEENDLESVAGGITLDNVSQPGYFLVRKNNDTKFSYKFSVDDFERYNEIINNVSYAGCKTSDDMEQARFDALLASGLLIQA